MRPPEGGREYFRLREMTDCFKAPACFRCATKRQAGLLFGESQYISDRRPVGAGRDTRGQSPEIPDTLSFTAAGLVNKFILHGRPVAIVTLQRQVKGRTAQQ